MITRVEVIYINRCVLLCYPSRVSELLATVHTLFEFAWATSLQQLRTETAALAIPESMLDPVGTDEFARRRNNGLSRTFSGNFSVRLPRFVPGLEIQSSLNQLFNESVRSVASVYHS